MRAQVNIISGFLGSGKTTLLTRQLSSRLGLERIGVIINDFGEARIDGSTIRQKDGFSITEIEGACVCCTAPDGFLAALAALVEEGVERVFVEPTGLAVPADLIDSIRRAPVGKLVAMGPLVVLVDPGGLGEAVPALVREQAEAADVLVCSRADLADEVALKRFDALAAELWPGPLAVHQMRGGELPAAAFDWPSGVGLRVKQLLGTTGAPQGPAGTHGHEVASRVWGAEVVFDVDRLTDVLAELAKRAEVVRVKGVFRTRLGVWRLEIAGKHVHEAPSGYRRDSRVDVIVASSAAGELPELLASLEQARLGAGEGRVDPERLVVVGLAEAPAFDRAALMALGEQVADISELVPGRSGAAVRVSAVLAAAGVDLSNPAEVVVVAADGFASPPVALSVVAQGLLLHTLDGGPLPPSKGGPFRLLIPQDAGPAGPCSNVKGTVRIELR